MKIELERFVVSGMLPGLAFGCSRAAILSALGQALIDTPQHKSYPAMLVYGALEFRLRDDKLCVIALSLKDDPPELPVGVVLDSSCGLHRDQIEAVLAKHDMSWAVDSIMSSDEAPILVTGNQVHIAFDRKRLARVVAESAR